MISILIPVWNQGRAVRQNFSVLAEALDKTAEPYEVIFIDDGSGDDTPSQLAQLQKDLSRIPIKIIRLMHRGQHIALFEGFKSAGGEFIITMDADQKVSPGYIPELLEQLKKGHDMVVAWRSERPGIGQVRRFGSRAMNMWTNIVTGIRLHDHSCSLKGFSAEFVKNNLSRPELRRFFGILAAKYAHKICEIKVACGHKNPKDSALGFCRLALLAVDFFINSIQFLSK
ncbi:MAG TPA: hypothetical protein DCL35_01095 [Candidatus Omnitrophica bacterium]|nr:hypothetical protein [Candidatus Omnitrophota bacterium]